jgi:nucleotide-binding universal stress UspA family protein
MPKSDQPKDRGYQSILCAVDFSPQSSAALQMAAELAGQSGGHLTALYVEDASVSLGAAAAGYDKTLLQKSNLNQLERFMDRIARSTSLPPDTSSVESLIGQPATAIVKFATKVSADLIVMGTNGRRGPAKLFFGSVTQAVLRRTSTPVLVVARSRPKRSAVKRLAHPVLAALELGPNERTDAKRMARAATLIGGPLTLLHVVRRVRDLLGTPALVDPYHHRQLTEARKKLTEIAASVGAASRVRLGIPEDEITAAASEMKAGLIVLALRRGRGLFGPRQGTTTYRILCASRTPVLALPPIARPEYRDRQEKRP